MLHLIRYIFKYFDIKFSHLHEHEFSLFSKSKIKEQLYKNKIVLETTKCLRFPSFIQIHM